jgi:predicted transcriptional regulator
MKTTKLNHPHIKLQIAYYIANGYSQHKIAKALGTSQPAIFRMVHRDDVQAMILQEEGKYLERIKIVLEETINNPQVKARMQKKVEKMLFDF